MDIKSCVVLFMYFESILGLCPNVNMVENVSKKKCYYLSDAKVNWDDARRKCEAHGSILAKILDDNDHQFLKQHMVDTHYYYWFGMNDLATDQTYVWTDDTPVTWVDLWRDQQPNGGSRQNCVTYDYDRLWQDKDCNSEYYYFICQTDAISDAMFFKVDSVQDSVIVRKLQVVDKVLCVLHCAATTNCIYVVVDMALTSNNCWLLGYLPGENVYLPYSRTMIIFQSALYHPTIPLTT